MKSSICIYPAVCPECLHHGLVIGLAMECSFHNLITLRHNRIHIAVSAFLMRHEITLCIGSHRHKRAPVIFRMNQYRIVLCFSEIEQRFLDIIFYFYHLQCFIYRIFIPSGNDSHRITDFAQSLIQYKSVVCTRLRICLSGNSEPILRHILVCIYNFNPGYRKCL